MYRFSEVVLLVGSALVGIILNILFVNELFFFGPSPWYAKLFTTAIAVYMGIVAIVFIIAYIKDRKVRKEIDKQIKDL